MPSLHAGQRLLARLLPGHGRSCQHLTAGTLWACTFACCHTVPDNQDQPCRSGSGRLLPTQAMQHTNGLVRECPGGFADFTRCTRVPSWADTWHQPRSKQGSPRGERSSWAAVKVAPEKAYLSTTRVTPCRSLATSLSLCRYSKRTSELRGAAAWGTSRAHNLAAGWTSSCA